MKKYLLILLMIIFTKEAPINLSELSNGSTECLTVDENYITFTCSEVYTLSGLSQRGLLISSPETTLNLNGVQITTTGISTPIIIKPNCATTINLNGTNSLQDSEQNEKNSVIYMEYSSRLTISSENRNTEVTNLYLKPSKGKGIYGEKSTNLNINGGIILLECTMCTGFINIGKDLIINNVFIKDSILGEDSNNYFSLKTGGCIKIQSGIFVFHSIQAEDDILLGPINSNDISSIILDLNIHTVNEGMKAKYIEIYYGQINIESEKDSIVSYGDIKIINSKLKILAGSSVTKSSPFMKNGELTIIGSNLEIYGTNCIAGDIINNEQASISYNEIPAPNRINIYMDDQKIITLEPYGIYIYFYWTDSQYQLTQQNEIQIKKNGEIVQSFDDSTCGTRKKQLNNSKFLKISSYLYFFINLLLF